MGTTSYVPQYIVRRCQYRLDVECDKNIFMRFRWYYRDSRTERRNSDSPIFWEGLRSLLLVEIADLCDSLLECLLTRDGR